MTEAGKGRAQHPGDVRIGPNCVETRKTSSGIMSVGCFGSGLAGSEMIFDKIKLTAMWELEGRRTAIFRMRAVEAF